MATEDVAKKVEDAINQHDADTLASIYAPQAVAEDPLTPEPLRGQDAIRKDFEHFLQAFPDLHARFWNVATNGDVLGAQVEFTGTHKGPLTTPQGTIQPTNKQVQMRGAVFARVSPEGLITEEYRYYDTGNIVQQLGLQQRAA